MKFKVGDRVRIRSLQWYLENKDENGEILFGERETQTDFMLQDLRIGIAICAVR